MRSLQYGTWFSISPRFCRKITALTSVIKKQSFRRRIVIYGAIYTVQVQDSLREENKFRVVGPSGKARRATDPWQAAQYDPAIFRTVWAGGECP